MSFRATLELHGRTATGIEVPAAVVDGLGAGRRPPVRVTVDGYSYRTTVASRGGRYLVGVSAEHRAGAGIAAGDEVDVEVELDTTPREIAVPDDLAAALAGEPAARACFDGLTYSQQRGYVEPITQAKRAETRERRVAKAVAMLREGRRG